MSRRPENAGPPEIFYAGTQAFKYANNSRIMDIQVQMCERAIELLCLQENKTHLLLDIGCGSGLSGNVLERKGHFWIGIDISPAMLSIGLNRTKNGDLILSDMGQGVPFKTATFDGAISISALQWLCNINNSKHILRKRLDIFFSTLFASLSSNARAVFQFYPENDEQINIITIAATKAGFFGGTIIDYPNSKNAKKIFLVLMTSNSLCSLNFSKKHKNYPHQSRVKQKHITKKSKKYWKSEEEKKHRKKYYN